MRHSGASVWGRVYRVKGDRDSVLAYLDHREKGGYERHYLEVVTTCGRRLQALSYIGSNELANFIGPEDEEITASVIQRAHGPSGENIDYLRRLHRCMVEFDRLDPHVDRLLALVEKL